MKEINRVDLIKLIEENRDPNTIFSVVFLKKSGEIRRMNCLLGVKKHLKGGVLKYNPSKLGYVIVLDTRKQAYRTINLNTISSITSKGVEYHVTA
ncbi:hypothetical protein CMI37_36660 [Candidatus Pacearchaeota archaeon]|nr:hypothetical protein [Candidatus Pacearchaeota archaeon]|tara:strand:- start:861 stop:1145 length:285 start_codon:yes stop_codon:yes gene_type:complete